MAPAALQINKILDTLEQEDYDIAVRFLMFLSDNRKKEKERKAGEVLKEGSNLCPLSGEEILMKLETSRKHADEGKYRDADAVISDLRAKYGL